MSRIARVFRKKALIPYICGGDPDIKNTGQIIKELARSGADIIEVGIPFSDPLADGPVIQAAGQRALDNGTTLKGILDMIKEIKTEVEPPLLLMGYYNSILQYGKDKFIEDAVSADISGVIIPDLPFDQDEDFYKKLEENGLAGILMVTPVTSDHRLKEIGKRARGFTYCVSLLGITGDNKGPIPGLEKYLSKVRKYIKTPLALGFGIDGPGKAARVINYVDGVIIGSALVKIIEENSKDSEKMLYQLRNFIEGIKGVLDTPEVIDNY